LRRINNLHLPPHKNGKQADISVEDKVQRRLEIPAIFKVEGTDGICRSINQETDLCDGERAGENAARWMDGLIPKAP